MSGTDTPRGGASAASPSGGLDPVSTWLFDPAATAGDGGRLRFKLLEVVVCLALISKAWSWALDMQGFERVLEPLALANYIDPSFMFGAPAYVNAALITAALAVGFARLWSPAYLVGVAGMMWHYAARQCLGATPHGTHMVGLCLLMLGLGAVAFERSDDRLRFSMGGIYFYVGTSYTLAAISKLIATGPAWVRGEHMQLWLQKKVVDAFARTGEYQVNAVQDFVLDNAWVGTLGLGGALVLEALGVLVWWPRARVPMLLGLVAMHLGIFHMMGIFFYFNIATLLVLALPVMWLDRAVADSAPSGALRRLASLARRTC